MCVSGIYVIAQVNHDSLKQQVVSAMRWERDRKTKINIIPHVLDADLFHTGLLYARLIPIVKLSATFAKDFIEQVTTENLGNWKNKVGD